MQADTVDSDIELRLATALAPMLLAISIFSLTLVGNIKDPSVTIVDEIFSFLSALCILGSATVADAIMDKAGKSISQRFSFLGGGYFLFCLAAGTMTTALPLLYLAKTNSATSIEVWKYLVFFATGFSVIIKLMLNKESAWTVGMFILFVGSICAIAITL